MNNFEPKNIIHASEYLTRRLKSFNKEKSPDKTNENVYIIEDKKEKPLKRFLDMLFKS